MSNPFEGIQTDPEALIAKAVLESAGYHDDESARIRDLAGEHERAAATLKLQRWSAETLVQLAIASGLDDIPRHFG